jgi:hypothetical protein
MPGTTEFQESDKGCRLRVAAGQVGDTLAAETMNTARPRMNQRERRADTHGEAHDEDFVLTLLLSLIALQNGLNANYILEKVYYSHGDI